jgi:4-hydroxybenzoate polyprenyltransferase
MNFKPFFQLVRIPTVFSAFSNAYAGYWIGGGGAPLKSLFLGMLAAALYLMAGMALNDIADYKVDKVERPSRPLPSGAISRPWAWIFSLGMMALALVCQWFANPVAACVGVCLILAIFLYNFLLKGTFLGEVSMGACRVLNLLGGIALCADGTSDLLFLPFSAYWALASIGVYIVIVTYLAKDEVQGNSRIRVRIFLTGMALWVALWIGFAAFRFSPSSFILLAVLLLHMVLLFKPVRNLQTNPASPAATGKTIGALLRSLPMTDVVGMLGAGVIWPWALLGLAWMLPGPFLAKRFYST